MATDYLTALKAKQDQHYKTLQQRLVDIDKQKSGLSDFFTQVDPIYKGNMDKINSNLPAGVTMLDTMGGFNTNMALGQKNAGILDNEKASIWDAISNAETDQIKTAQDMATANEPQKLSIADALKLKENGLTFKGWDNQGNPIIEGGEQLSADKLIADRKARKDAGLDTTAIDEQLKSLGINQNDPTTDPRIKSLAEGIASGKFSWTKVSPDDVPYVSDALTKMGYDPAKKINNLIKDLENMYWGDVNVKDPTNTKKGTDLASGWDAGILSAPLTGIESLFNQFGKWNNSEKGMRAEAYNNWKEGFVTSLKTIVGDSGVPTKEDVARWMQLFPKETDTPAEAKATFKRLRGQIEAQYGVKLGSGSDTSTSTPVKTSTGKEFIIQKVAD